MVFVFFAAMAMINPLMLLDGEFKDPRSNVVVVLGQVLSCLDQEDVKALVEQVEIVVMIAFDWQVSGYSTPRISNVVTEISKLYPNRKGF